MAVAEAGIGGGVPGTPGAPVVVACMKLVELRAGIDPLTGLVLPDPLSAGPSPADEAALEWALRIGEAAGGPVVAICAGGSESEEMLRGAIAAGAARAVRVSVGAEASSEAVAGALAGAVRSLLAGGGSPGGALPVVVCCGAARVDRGSGAVPAFLADELAAAQALGLVGVKVAGAARELEVERRLDRGRRERLRVGPPCVISVEAVTARLRRASLDRALSARSAHIQMIEPGPGRPGSPAVELVGLEPFRPRTRVVPPPPAGLGPRERILDLTGALHERPTARTLVLEPEQAADELLSTLAEWGELPEGLVAPRAGHDEPETP